MILYFFEDQTNAGKNAKAMMTYVAMISLVFSLLAVWPAGFLSDKFGSGIVAALGSILMSRYAVLVWYFEFYIYILVNLPNYKMTVKQALTS
jgi:MFS family permease